MNFKQLTLTPEQLRPDEELQRVMAEVAEALGGTHAALTLHPEGREPRLIYADPTAQLDSVIADLLESGTLNWRLQHVDQHQWVTVDLAPYAPEALALPVRRVIGHSRLVITVFFAELDDAQRSAAEEIYAKRRPLAVGYFRLWQHERLQRREIDASRAALDRVKVGVTLLTKSGEMAFANEAAVRLLESDSGIREQHGKLTAQDRIDNVTLGASIAHVLDGSERPDVLECVPLLTVKRAGRSPLVVAVLPVPYPVTELGETAAIVIAVDPDIDIRPYASAICSVFGLTRMETELCCDLASGATVQQAAARLKVKEETTRRYLKSVFAKTGVNRQADLVRMILVSLVRV